MPLQSVQGLADREGAVIKEVELDHDKDVILERVERAITPRTRLICFQSRHHRFGHPAAG